MLYVVGVIFFAGVWAVEKFALIRIHQLPPPYSYKLIGDTLWWLPWAAGFHIGFAFWGFASLPSVRPSGWDGVWSRPFDGLNLTMALHAPPAGNANGLEAILGHVDRDGSGFAASLLSALDKVYDLPSHINSLATLALFGGTLFVLILLLLRASPLYVFWRPAEILLESAADAAWDACAGRRRTARVAPYDARDSKPTAKHTASPDLKAGDARAAESDAPTAEMGDSGAPAAAASQADEPDDEPPPPPPLAEDSDSDDDGPIKVIDPPFPKMLQGVKRSNVRMLDGRVIHAFQRDQRSSRRTLCGRMAALSPNAFLFRFLGMREDDVPRVSDAEWAAGKRVFSQLTGAADISYQPEFHPKYEKAFMFLAEPGQLTAFSAGIAKAVTNKWKKHVAKKNAKAQKGWDQRAKFADSLLA